MANPILQRVDETTSRTLNTQTVATDGSTTVAFKLAGIATDLVEAKTVKINGEIGPTIAARFYAIVGSAMYEAQQIFYGEEKTSLGRRGSDRKLEKMAKRAARGLNGSAKDEFIDNVIAYATAEVMRNQAPGVDALKIVEEGLTGALNDIGIANYDAKRIGIAIAETVIQAYALDGSAAGSSYNPKNSSPTNIKFIDKWTPEYNVGDNPSSGIQKFLTPQWGNVNEILGKKALNTIKSGLPNPEPFLLDPNAKYDLSTRKITHFNGQDVDIDINSAAVGQYINPDFIAQAQRVVDASRDLTPEQKLIAEFWEDGPGTGFPPGTWVEFGRYASELYDNTRQEDVRMFFGIGQALFSASVASWGLKAEKDYTRPLTAIRELSRLGLLRDEDPIIGGVQVESYDRNTQATGIINGKDWKTYQTFGNFFSPPFTEYVSGHSTFSSAAGRVIDLITGRSDFGGSVTTKSLIEAGKPDNPDVTLTWETWRDAWTESGISRIYGGIHFDQGNENGLILGERIGDAVFAKVSELWS